MNDEGREAVTLDTESKQVINPLVKFGSGNTLDLTGATVIGGGGGGAPAVFSNPGGRLTLQSGVPVPTSDQIARTILYYTPYKHNNVFTYSGTAWQQKAFSEISLAIAVATGRNYDVFINAAGNALSLSNPWTSDISRADALGTQDSVIVLGSDHTKLWLGTIRGSGLNVTEDSAGGTTSQVGGKRFVWNAYNQVRRSLSVIDTTDSWSYTTNVIRQANAAAGNKVEYVCGVTFFNVDVTVVGSVLLSGNSGFGAKSAVGVDSTTTFSGLVSGAYISATSAVICSITGRYSGAPGMGYHYLSWNEKGADGSCFFNGDNGGDSEQTGLIAVGDF